MLRRTYGSVKAELARVCGDTGMTVNDPRVMAYTNLAIEEFLSEGDWPTAIDRLKFRINRNKFVLPSDYDRCLYLTVCNQPVQMQSPWYEFVGYGLDLWNGPGASEAIYDKRYFGVLDKDAVATFEDIPETGGLYYPRVYGLTDERVDGVRPVMNIQGYDADNNWVRTSNGSGGFIDGVNIEINGDTDPFYIESTQSFSYITQTNKPVTKKNVEVWVSTGPSDTSPIYIVQSAWKDTTPFYREYSIPNLFWDGTNVSERTIIARCRRRFVPIVEDSDFLLITNLPALTTMVQAVYYRWAKDLDNYAKMKLVAIDMLKKEAKAYIGLTNQKPVLTISEGAGERFDGIYIL